MIKQEINYISKKKKKFLMMTLLWTTIVLCVFITGLVITGTRSTYFTLVATLFVLPLVQNMTRYIAFYRFKDPSIEYASILEQMQGNYQLFHGVIMPDDHTTVFFEHLIITSEKLYFLTYDKEIIQKYQSFFENKLLNKGIDPKNIHFVEIADLKSLNVIISQIEKQINKGSDGLENYSKLLEAMMM